MDLLVVQLQHSLTLQVTQQYQKLHAQVLNHQIQTLTHTHAHAHKEEDERGQKRGTIEVGERGTELLR